MKTMQVKLGDFCSITSSKRIFESEYVSEGIPFFRSKEIIEKESGKTNSNYIFISKIRYDEIKKKFGVPQPGDVLLTSVGTIGIPYVIKENDLFYFKDGNLTWLRDFSSEMDSKYLYYWLRSKFGKQSLIQRAIGSSQAAITIDILKKYQLFLQPIENQKKIVSVLSAYDELIEKNSRKIAILQEQVQELYKEWFVRFRFPGHETAKFENGLPEGWRRTTVEELSDVLRRGISPEYSDDGDLIVISQKCIRGSIMDVKKARNQVKRFSDELNLLDSDTVICSTGTGTLGRVGQIFGEYPDTTFDSHVTLVRARNGISKQYLFFALSSMQAWFMSMGIGSTNQQELYQGTIKNAKVVLPNRDMMNLFEAIAKGIHERITVLGRQSDILTRQRDLLLPRLMSGKLEVH